MDSLLTSYNLFSTADFQTRITNHSSTVIDNIFLNNIITDFSIQSRPNGFSDRDPLLLMLNNIRLHITTAQYTNSRLINECTLSEFQSKLSYEFWDSVFNGEDIDTIFNEFINTYFRFLWPCIVSKLWSERENQQDAAVRCLFSTISQHVSGIIMPIFRRTRHMLLHVVCCTVTSGES